MSNVIDLEKERQKRAAKKYVSSPNIVREGSPEYTQLIRQSIARINRLFTQTNRSRSRLW